MWKDQSKQIIFVNHPQVPQTTSINSRSRTAGERILTLFPFHDDILGRPLLKQQRIHKKTPFINSRKETKGFQGTGTNIRSCGTKCPKNLDRWFFEATTQKDNERTRRSREFFETAGKNHIFLYRWSWNTLIQEQSLLIIQAYCNYIFASTCIVTCCPYPLKIYVYYEDSLKNGSTLMIFSDSGLYLALKLHHIERIGFNWEFFEVVALLIDATWWSF